jgi:diguanylate cyclase (GGDEF)-like protein/PAS domain S-box-containing protein
MHEKADLPLTKVLMDGIKDLLFVMKVEDNSVFYYDFLNRAAMEETGLDNSVLGKSITEVYSKEKAELLKGYYKKVAATQKNLTYEDSFLSSSGSILYSKTSLTPLIDQEKCTHIVAVVKDITEQKMANMEMNKYMERLNASEQRFRLIAEHAHDLIMLLDDKGIITYASPSYSEVLGYNHREYVGKLFFYNVHPDDINHLEGTISQSLTTGKSCKLQFRQKHLTKGWIWSELHGTPVFDDHGHFAHMVIISRDISLQKEHEALLHHFAYHDPLTDLPNRRLFKEKLAKALEELMEKKSGLAVIMLDIDDFKFINDHMGHDTGDAVITEFGKRVKNHIRDIDTVARLGGDEFVILVPRLQGTDKVAAIARRMQKVMEKPWRINGYDMKVTTSMGIAVAPLEGATVSFMLKKADEALYESKGRGKNNYTIRVL